MLATPPASRPPPPVKISRNPRLPGELYRQINFSGVSRNKMDFAAAARTATNEMYLKEKLKQWDDMDRLAAHYDECGAVGKWLGRSGTTPKDSLKLFPLPKHSQTNNTCPGCNCEVYAKCLSRVAKPVTEN